MRSPACEADLRDAPYAGVRPADVARRELRVDYTVQAVGFDPLYVLQLGFDADQKAAVDRQTELACDVRMRAVRTDQILGLQAVLAEPQKIAAALRAVILGSGTNERTGTLCFSCEPAQQCRGVGREEIIARRFEIDPLQR